MTEADKPAEHEALFARLLRRWAAWLRLRHRALGHLHADILQDATADLVHYLSRTSPHAVTDEDIARIGFTILRRRIADEFRSKALQWAEGAAPDDLPATDPSTDPEQVLRYARLLRSVIDQLARLDRQSRELLLRRETGADAPLSDAQRQRLSRLRADLRRRLLDEHGIDVREFFRE
jgi:DNA-directed RNA polymerase specialized sigma24 family protein